MAPEPPDDCHDARRSEFAECEEKARASADEGGNVRAPSLNSGFRALQVG